MWTYVQKTGDLSHNGQYISTGYAGGNCGKNKEGIDNPALQNVAKVGPLPQGKYTFGQPVQQSHLGPFAIPLVPSPDNQMFGRNDFYCHGDTTPSGNASEGCLILARAIRNMIAASPDKDLEVVSGE